jgi:2-haloacid dehalogenase
MSTSTFGGFQGIAFDAYGTLFDVAHLQAACAAVCDDGDAFSRLWRTKQLEYAVLRTVMDRYADFGQITSDALDYTATFFGVALDPVSRRNLMRAWLELPPFPDVPPALDHLSAAGQRMTILSNGPNHMLDPLVARAGLTAHFIDIISVDRVQVFKPHPLVYHLLPERLHARMNEILFVTSNGFDVAGAKAAGLTVCRVDRAGLPLDPLGFEPDITVRDLGELANLLLGDPDGSTDGVA